MKLIRLTLLAALAIFACNDDSTGEDEPGNRNSPCKANGTCDDDLACIGGLCLESCGANYYSSVACLAAEYCKPFPGGDSNGYCVKADCNDAVGCTVDGEVCAQIKELAGACLTACAPTFVDGSYADNCGTGFCQAVGVGADRQLVCLPSTQTGQPIGTLCNAIDEPCASGQYYLSGGGDTLHFGLTCVNSQCIELCEPSANPASNTNDCGASVARGATYCCAQTGANGLQFGICIPFSGTSTCDPFLY